MKTDMGRGGGSRKRGTAKTKAREKLFSGLAHYRTLRVDVNYGVLT